MKLFKFLLLVSIIFSACANKESLQKPRILVSTDIGGTDPDDNQSMVHLLMYSDCFELEGLVSSPSFGKGSKEEILRMIDLYEKDFPKLNLHIEGLMSPNELRKICKQGRRGNFPYNGLGEPTEGSEWIIQCARKQSNRPLWILVWGGLEDLAQALHDAPDIIPNIRVYWIGGPNKKWCVNSYAYIVENFPDLWIIENNASYRGFISDNKKKDAFNTLYYEEYVKNAGHMGADFINYYDGIVKMGDTPSLLYLMHGDPDNPQGDSWGGSFEQLKNSPRYVFNRHTTIQDTVSVYSIIEYHLQGPVIPLEPGTPCFTFHIDKQNWDGYYLGEGVYGIRYAAKAPATLEYTITSAITELDGIRGCFVVNELWPGTYSENSYPLGNNWFTDKKAPDLFNGKWQGFKTVSKWREEVLTDWATRWEFLQ